MTTTPMTASSNTSSPTYSNGESAFEKPTIAGLNGYYTDGDSADQEVFSEMRSNCLLVSGEHYSKRRSIFYKRIRDSRELSQEQKIRLIKNHCQKICKIYTNNIISSNPGVGFSPKDETSMHDKKVAELHHSVWRDGYERYNIDDKVDDWCDSFVQIGEVIVKIFWDPNLGPLKGYEAQTDPETGNPMMDETMQPMPDMTKPVAAGEFVFEEVYGFNLLRPPECKDIRKAEWLCIRKMANKDELTRKWKDQPDILKFITTNQDETYSIFDPLKGGYRKTSKETMIREYYFRPSMLFPQGYFYITTKDGILSEGELPGGLFPIVISQFDKIPTTPRGRSPVKTMRPYQGEINRSASKIAEHQITLGDDKLLVQNGTKTSAGVSLPGVRTVNYTGGAPTVMPGRDGSQYLAYMQSQITELYQVMMVSEQAETNQEIGQLDPYSLLFRSARQKKNFQRYIKRFEKFLIEIVHLYLRLAKIHMPDDTVIMAVGKNEAVNIAEFRMLPDTAFEIKLEAQSEDIETKLGKQLIINHALQYVSNKLESDDIGKLLKNSPFANFTDDFSDLTLDYDTAQNNMLALDRGEQPPVNQYDNHTYLIKKLTSRMAKPDFAMLTPQIQQNYAMKVQVHQQMEAARVQALQRAESGFIPTDGYLVTCQIYVKDPADPSGVKTRLARVPYTALSWLINKLEDQGQGQAELQSMNEGAQAQIAGMVNQGRPQQVPSPGTPAPSGPPQGSSGGMPPNMMSH